MQHSISDLRYRLVCGPVDIQPLIVVESRVIRWDEWTVGLSILGASHAINLTHESTEITELLTCVPPCGDAFSLIDMRCGPNATACISREGVTLQVHLMTIPLDDSNLLLEREIDGELAHQFGPMCESAAPCTRIGWRAFGNRLTAETIHTYPEENMAIRSLSIFELERAL